MKRLTEIKKLTKQNGGEAPTEAELADAGLSAPLVSPLRNPRTALVAVPRSSLREIALGCIS